MRAIYHTLRRVWVRAIYHTLRRVWARARAIARLLKGSNSTMYFKRYIIFPKQLRWETRLDGHHCMHVICSFTQIKILLCLYFYLCKEYKFSLVMSEPYLEPSQTPMMKLFAKIVTGSKP